VRCVCLQSVATVGVVRLGDSFEARPVMFDIPAGQTALLDVLFAPRFIGEFSESLSIICDNCHVRHLTVTGMLSMLVAVAC